MTFDPYRPTFPYSPDGTALLGSGLAPEMAWDFVWNPAVGLVLKHYHRTGEPGGRVWLTEPLKPEGTAAP